MNDLEAIDKLCERFFGDTSHDARNGAAQDLARAVPDLAAEIRRLRAENAKLPALLRLARAAVDLTPPLNQSRIGTVMHVDQRALPEFIAARDALLAEATP